MSIFVTDNGFIKKTFEDLKLEYEALFKSAFGDDIDLEPSGAFGQIIGILAKRDADLWDGAEEIYTSRNPSEATGVSLDNIAAETGLFRGDSTPTVVADVQMFGTEGTVIPAGTQVRQTGSPIIFALDSSVTITKAAARYTRLTLATPAGGGGTVYTLTINGDTYTFTSLAGDTKANVITELIALIVAGAWTGTASNDSDVALELTDVSTAFAFTVVSSLTIDVLASGGTYTALTDGVNIVPANTLVDIINSVSGWDSVNNPVAGITGSAAESDLSFRIRRAKTVRGGNATDEAIRSKLLSEVDSVTDVIVASNRTLSTDTEGRPAKSFEAVVVGGLDADVAAKIWEVQPSGIASYGNTTVFVLDSYGGLQPVLFSRPVDVYIWVIVQRDFYDEEIYPADGDELIKAAIVEWAAVNQTLGKDVIRQRLSIPIYSIAGIGDIEILIASGSPTVDPTTQAAVDIAIAYREVAQFSESRITVEALP